MLVEYSVTIPREYSDPRLVALYDALNPLAADSTFYIDLAAELAANSIVDIGCGTGLLAHELARRGHEVTGIDPSGAMLNVARHRHPANRAHWLEGTASRLGEECADLAIMSGHVAQVITSNQEWNATLAAIRRALRPGGHLAFESRNPEARQWATSWTKQTTLRYIDGASYGRIAVWYEVSGAWDTLVRFEVHYHFLSDDKELVSENELRFRDSNDLIQSLAAAEFSVERIYGDWDRRPSSKQSPELIFVAIRR